MVTCFLSGSASAREVELRRGDEGKQMDEISSRIHFHLDCPPTTRGIQMELEWDHPWCLGGRTGTLMLQSTAFLAHFTIPSRLHSDGRRMQEQRRKEQHSGANWPLAREQ